MAPEINAVVAAVNSKDTELAENAASLLVSSLPKKTREQIVQELLSRLQQEKKNRELQGLNHWEEYAPQYLGRIVKRHDGKRRAAIADFIAARHEEALQFVCRITGNQDLAEKVLGQTYVELLEGRTTIPFFFRALKLNARNALEKQCNERNRFQSLDSMPSGCRSDYEPEMESEAQEFVSPHSDDQDPLAILIQREEAATVQREIYEAREIAETDRRFWWIRQQKWARDLQIGASQRS